MLDTHVHHRSTIAIKDSRDAVKFMFTIIRQLFLFNFSALWWFVVTYGQAASPCPLHAGLQHLM